MKDTEKKETLKERMSFLQIDTENVSTINSLSKAVFDADTTLQDLNSKVANRELNLCYSNNAIVALMEITAEDAYRKLAIRDLSDTETAKQLAVDESQVSEDAKKEYNSKVDAICANLRKIAKDAKGRYYNYTSKKAVLLDTDQKVSSFAEALWAEYLNQRQNAKDAKKRLTLTEKITAKLLVFSKVKGLSADEIVASVAATCKCSTADVVDVIKTVKDRVDAKKDAKKDTEKK